MGASGTCCSGGKDTPQVGQPLQSQEVLGVDKMQAPGFHTRAEIARNGEPDGNDSNNTRDAIPGGDSAAGGDVAVGRDGKKTEDNKTITYDDNSSYTGQTLNEKRHGQGIWQSRTGQYEGQWQDDQQHGNGYQTWSDGRSYNGQFVLGKFSGSGRMEWHTQKGLLVYEGEYQDDLKQGTGKFVWADGRNYEGQWVAGKRHGKGIYTNARSERKVGYWVQDRFDRWADDNNDSSKPET